MNTTTTNDDNGGDELSTPLWPTVRDLEITANQWYDDGIGAAHAAEAKRAEEKLRTFTSVDAKAWPRRFWAKLDGPQAPTPLGVHFALVALAALPNAYIAYRDLFAPRPAWAERSYLGAIFFSVLVLVTLAFWLVAEFNHWQARGECRAHLKMVKARHVKPNPATVVKLFLKEHLEHKMPEDLFLAELLLLLKNANDSIMQALMDLSDNDHLKRAVESTHPVYMTSIYGQHLLLSMKAESVRKCASTLLAKLEKAAQVKEDSDAADTEEHLSDVIKRLLPEINVVCAIVALAVIIHGEGKCGAMTRHEGWKKLEQALQKQAIA